MWNRGWKKMEKRRECEAEILNWNLNCNRACDRVGECVCVCVIRIWNLIRDENWIRIGWHGVSSSLGELGELRVNQSTSPLSHVDLAVDYIIKWWWWACLQWYHSVSNKRFTNLIFTKSHSLKTFGTSTKFAHHQRDERWNVYERMKK